MNLPRATEPQHENHCAPCRERQQRRYTELLWTRRHSGRRDAATAPSGGCHYHADGCIWLCSVREPLAIATWRCRAQHRQKATQGQAPAAPVCVAVLLACAPASALEAVAAVARQRQGRHYKHAISAHAPAAYCMGAGHPRHLRALAAWLPDWRQ